ncbi:unnamed protein product [Camellia sinensis]
MRMTFSKKNIIQNQNHNQNKKNNKKKKKRKQKPQEEPESDEQEEKSDDEKNQVTDEEKTDEEETETEEETEEEEEKEQQQEEEEKEEEPDEQQDNDKAEERQQTKGNQQEDLDEEEDQQQEQEEQQTNQQEEVNEQELTNQQEELQEKSDIFHAQETRHKLLLMYPNQHRVPMKKKRRRMTTKKRVLMKQNNSRKKRCKNILAKRKQLLLKQTQKSMTIKRRQNFKYWKVMMISRKNQSQTSHSPFHAAKQTSACVIDAFSEKQLALQPTIEEFEKNDLVFASNPYAGRSYVFSILINTPLQNQDQALREKLMDSHFPEAMKNRYIHFPINHDNHWTIVVFDNADGIWRHYDSLRPAKDCHNKHFEIAKQIQQHQLRWNKSLLNKQGNMLSSQECETEIASIEECPQQTPHSNDCAIAVCNVINKYLNWQPVQKKLRPTEWVKFRAQIINQFLNDENRSWKLEHYQMLTKHTKP